MKASNTIGRGGVSVDNETFLLCCLEHVQDLKIDMAAVAKDLGYASATAAGNRLRNMRKKLESDKGGKQTEAVAPKDEKETDAKPKTTAKPRGKKRKKSSSADLNEESD
ncbi:hypothetical protein ABW21_db0208344 [Orbilia brochopaga]|nr:hypothetical protein ABW21_db0208344 [Drechslerella brochopaga]